MRIVTGCKHPTYTDFLPVLVVGIAPVNLRKEMAIGYQTHHRAQQAVLDKNHPFNQFVTEAIPVKCQMLKSCHSFLAMLQLFYDF